MSKTLRFMLYLMGSLIACSIFLSHAQAKSNRPFPQHIKYAPSTIKPNYRNQTQLDNINVGFSKAATENQQFYSETTNAIRPSADDHSFRVRIFG